MKINKPLLHAFLKESVARIEDLKFLKQLQDVPLSQLISLVGERFPILGKGSARTVFSIDDTLVIKVAQTQKGVDQNKVEANIKTCSTNTNLFAKTISHAEDFSWIMMERVIPLESEQEFSEKIDIDTDLLRRVLVFWYAENMQTTRNKNFRPKEYDESTKHPFVMELIQIIKQCDLLPLDISKYSSWGTTENGRMVLIDYGLTKQVFLTHYH